MSWRLHSEQVALVVVDAQEKLLPIMAEAAGLEAKLKVLAKGLDLLGVPIYITEQYPKGLGKTVASLLEGIQPAGVFEKNTFSAGFLAKEIRRKHLIIAGMEAHICVRQTVYDLRRQEKEITVIADAVGSRDPEMKRLALDELRTDGVLINTVEGLLFELLETSEHPKFKEISKLVR